jgi:hypothetical protein
MCGIRGYFIESEDSFQEEQVTGTSLTFGVHRKGEKVTSFKELYSVVKASQESVSGSTLKKDSASYTSSSYDEGSMCNDDDSQVIGVGLESVRLPAKDVKINSASLCPDKFVGNLEWPQGSVFLAAVETTFWVQRLYKITLKDLNKRAQLFNYFYSIYISSGQGYDPHKCLPDLNTVQACTRRLLLKQVYLQFERLVRELDNAINSADDLGSVEPALEAVCIELNRYTKIKTFGGTRNVNLESIDINSSMNENAWKKFSKCLKAYLTSKPDRTVKTLNRLEQTIWSSGEPKRSISTYEKAIMQVQSEREFVATRGLKQVQVPSVQMYTRVNVDQVVAFFHKLAVALNRIHLLELKVSIFELLHRIHRLCIHSRSLTPSQRKRVLKGLKSPIYRYQILYQEYQSHCEAYRKLKQKYYWSFVEGL